MSKKIQSGFDPNIKLRNLRGQAYPKTFPTTDELKALAEIDGYFRGEDGTLRPTKVPDRSKLEQETVGNVILNCFAGYIHSKRSAQIGYYTNTIASKIVTGLTGNKKVVLNDALLAFLVTVLKSQIMSLTENEKKEKTTTGVYSSWVIAQVLEELGEDFAETEVL